MLLTAMDVVQQLHQALIVQTLAQIVHKQNANAPNDIFLMRS
jgi:hypothetical protein